MSWVYYPYPFNLTGQPAATVCAGLAADGMPVGLHSFCLSSRRATARVHPDGRVEFRADPMWFTDYYRREGVE